MPNKTKSRVSKTSTKKSGFKFRWWMGLALVAVVAVVGLLVLRYSKAAGGTVAQFGGSDCTRVNLTHVYSKGANVTNNVCMGTVDFEEGFVYDASILTGRPATYCVWGRIYTKNPSDLMSIKLTTWGTNLNGRSEGQLVDHTNNSGITGYGTNFTANPGGNIKLACVNASTPNVSRFRIDAWALKSNHADHSSGLVFMDQITVEY